MYPRTLDDAVEAAEIFTTVGEYKLAGNFATAGQLLDDYITEGCDHTDRCAHSGRRLLHLIMTGAMVTADMVRARVHNPPPNGFWVLGADDGGALDDIETPDLAALQILVATLNQDHGAAQDVLSAFVAGQSARRTVGVLGSMIGLYVMTVGGPR